MSGATNDPVREYLAGAITAAGGIVEDGHGALDALLPAQLAREWAVPEAIRIRLSGPGTPGGDADGAAGADAADIIDGRIGSPFLERLVTARLATPALGAVAFPAGFSAALPDRLPALLNAVRGGAPERLRARRRYLAAEVRATLHGEELRSAHVALTIRLDDGAPTEPFRIGGSYPIEATPLDEDERRRAALSLRTWLWREGPALHAIGLEALRQRGARDLGRMTDYYASLDREMERADDRARSSDERARRQAKWAALPADLDARRDQLRTRLRPRLAARIVAATLIDCDVEQFAVPVRRRKREGRVTMTYRTADGVWEGPACAACGLASERLYLCDDRLHVLCAACGQSGVLDPARCRACRGAERERPVVRLPDPTAQLRLGPSPDA